MCKSCYMTFQHRDNECEFWRSTIILGRHKWPCCNKNTLSLISHDLKPWRNVMRFTVVNFLYSLWHAWGSQWIFFFFLPLGPTFKQPCPISLSAQETGRETIHVNCLVDDYKGNMFCFLHRLQPECNTYQFIGKYKQGPWSWTTFRCGHLYTFLLLCKCSSCSDMTATPPLMGASAPSFYRTAQHCSAKFKSLLHSKQ